MFDYFYLIMSVFCVSSTGVLGGYYTRRTTDKKDASALYGFVELCAVFVLWCVLFAMNPSFDVAAGVGNVFLNVFVMLMAVSSLSPTLIYPTIAVGGLIITTCFSVLAFREKLKWWQWIGVAIGIIATAILS